MWMWLWRVFSSITGVHRTAEKFLGHDSGEVGAAADRNLCGSEEHLGLTVANLSIRQHWGLTDLKWSYVLGFAPGSEPWVALLLFTCPGSWASAPEQHHLVFADTEIHLSSHVLLCRAIRASSRQGFWFLENKLTNLTLQDYHFLLLFLEVFILKPWN